MSHKKPLSLFPLAVVLIGIAGLLPKSAAAQDQDPPSRVARLNYMQGTVSFQLSGSQDWVQADPNRPLTTGDNLWADQNSRAEVHVGSTAIRLSGLTGLSFLTLDDRTVQLQLPQGAIEVHVRNISNGDAFEIDTPNLAFTVTRPGEYRIETDPNGGSTRIVVREGSGEVTGGGESWDLGAGQQYAFNGTDELSYDATGAPGFDDFEDWCQSRDERENNSPSAHYVSRDVDGYYDLDDYGDWRSDDDYGMVWVPRGVAAGWAPYHVGHWVWIGPWGWTWVDEEPWGFAPFHYGRWVNAHGYWGWVPGPVVVRPVYAPALVGFVGGGGFGFSASFGGGFSGVAWFPLGPRDVFVPGYHCSPHYMQYVNVTNTRVVNVTQVTNVYNTVIVNRNYTSVNYTYARNTTAVTAVSRDAFVNARSVGRESVRVTDDQISHARVTEANPVAPTRTSYVSATARVSNARPAVPFEKRAVVARLNPATPVARRTPQFTNQSSEFNRGGNANPPAPRGGSAAVGAGSTIDRGGAGGNTNPPPSQGGFRSFQQPGNQGNQTPANPPQPSRNNADRLGQPANPGNQNPGSATPQPSRNNQFSRQENSKPQVAPPPPPAETARPLRFAAPPKAREENYDVHPPLNHQTAEAPRPEEKRPEPPPRPQPREEPKKEK